MVVGPGIGSYLNRDDQATAKRPVSSETRLASADLGADVDHPLRTASSARATNLPETPEPAAAPLPFTADGTENPDLERYEEGIGADTGLPPGVVVTESVSSPGAAEIEAAANSIEPATPRERAPRRDAARFSDTAVVPPVPSERRRVTAPSAAAEKTSSREVVDESKRTRKEVTQPAERPATRPERAPAAAAERDKRKPSRTEPSRTEPARTEPARTTPPKETGAAEAPSGEEKLFRVRVGRVTPREDAERLRDELKDTVGVDAFLVRSGDGFRVQTGAYRDRANAEKIAAELRAGNFRPEVTQD